MTADDDSTVAAVDIARLAGVGRAAVGNWRRRFTDFPDPVGGTASSPLYRLGDVERWLTAHDRAIEVSAADRVWQWLRTEVDDLQLGSYVGQLGVFAVFLQREPQTWQALVGTSDAGASDPGAVGRAVSAAVPELPAGFPERPDAELLGVLGSVADVVARQGAAETFRFLVERYFEAHLRRLPVTPQPIAEFLVRLADVSGRSVLDPACGTGSVLTAAHAAGATLLAGQEIDAAAARLSGVQLLLQQPGENGRSRAEVAVGDSLRADAFAGRRFGAVASFPPWGDRGWSPEELAGDPRWEYGLPPRGEPDLAWLQHCLAHVEPGGTAAVLMPPPAAARRAGRRIRSNLLRAGVVRAVIGLPPEVAGACDAWLLRRPRAGDGLPTHVLMAVAADLAAVAPLWDAFRRDPCDGDGDRSRAVPIIDLLDDEVDLSPARHVRPAAGPAVTRFGDVRGELEAALAGLAVPDLTLLSTPRDLPMTTVGELVRAGVVTLSQAPLRMMLDDEPGGVAVLTAKDVAARRGPTGRTRDQPGLVLLAPDDAVTAVIAGRDTEVRVITDGGVALGPRLLCLRADPARLDPQFLAGFLRVSVVSPAHPLARRSPTGSSRTDARRVPIPLLPVAEQRAYGAAFARLAGFLDLLRRCAATGEELVELGCHGLADGMLGPG